MNKTALIEVLHDKVNASSSLQEILIISKSIEALKIGIVKTVATYINLLETFPLEGEVYFVEDEERLYFSLSSFWIRVTDTPVLSSYAWGPNGGGQLGDNTIAAKSSPVSVVGGFADWLQLDAGGYHSLGLRGNGTAWAWGSNTDGEIGDGTTVNKSSPILVAGGFTDWVQVSGGTSHSLGLRANGVAYAWGSGISGVLGNNDVTNRSSPVTVVGEFTDWVQLSASGHSLGLRANGTAWAWGGNSSGQLGNNETNFIGGRSSPVSVVGGFTDWVQLSAGGHSLGVRANGTAWAWGSNTDGEIGDGTTVAKSSPVSVVGGFTDWVQVSSGRSHSLGVRANGTAWGWGYNVYGILGDGTVVSKSSPVSVLGGFTDWVQVSGGDFHSLGLRANGSAWAWGNNGEGELGNGVFGPVAYKSSPVSVVGGFTDWVQINAGIRHSLAIRSL